MAPLRLISLATLPKCLGTQAAQGTPTVRTQFKMTSRLAYDEGIARSYFDTESP